MFKQASLRIVSDELWNAVKDRQTLGTLAPAGCIRRKP
jgi:hypothetical protein